MMLGNGDAMTIAIGQAREIGFGRAMMIGK